EQTEDLRGFEWYYLAQLGQSHKVWQDFDGPLRRIATDSTGRTIAALTTKGLSVWDGLTGEERRRIPGGATIHSARFFPDGRSLGVWRVAPNHPHHVALEVIDLQTGSIINSFPPIITTEPDVIPFLPGHRVLWGNGSKVQLRSVLKPTIDEDIDQPGATWLGLAATPDTNTIVRHWTANGRVHLDHRQRQQASVTEFPEPIPPCSQLAVSANGRFIAGLRQNEETLLVWDAQHPKLFQEFGLARYKIKSIIVVGSERILALGHHVGDRSDLVEIGELVLETGQWSTQQFSVGCRIDHAVLSDDGETIVLSGMDQTVRRIARHPAPAPQRIPAHANFEVWAVAVAPDGKTIFTGGDDAIIHAWNSATGELRNTYRGHTALVTAIAFAPDGQTWYSASFDGTVCEWNRSSAEPLRRLNHGERIRDLKIDPTGQRLATCGDDGCTRLWDRATFQPGPVLNDQSKRVRSIMFTPNGQEIITAGFHNTLTWCDVSTGKELRRVAEINRISCMALSPDGTRLALGSEEGPLLLRNAQTGELITRVLAPASRKTSIAYAPDGRTIATSSLDGTVRLWSADQLQELFQLAETGPAIYGLAFTPQGTVLAATRHNSELLLWNTIRTAPPENPR
ncbi:MAG: WD40 repeat domain-containing protein, partial [Gemmataceae bacterium]